MIYIIFLLSGLPLFSSAPNISSDGLVWWRPWSATVDYGTPPVGAYRLEYNKNGTNIWSSATTVKPNASVTEPDRYEYKPTMLQLGPGREYRFRLSLPLLDNGKLGLSIPGPSTHYINISCTGKLVTLVLLVGKFVRHYY